MYILQKKLHRFMQNQAAKLKDKPFESHELFAKDGLKQLHNKIRTKLVRGDPPWV